MHGDASPKLSYEECLALEHRTGTRHEFLNGDASAIAGGTIAHALVKTNLTRAIASALDGKPCLALDSDQKIDVTATGLATYPDLSVTCGPIVRSPRDRNAITNPTVLVEVLSPSTKGHDLGFKLRHYRHIPSLRQILFAWPEERSAEVHTRGENGTWIVRSFEGNVPVELHAIDVILTHDQIFSTLTEVAEHCNE